MIELQRQIVLKHVKNPVFCTNLYGEVMELYNDGYIKLHPDIIKVWADNGYGRKCAHGASATTTPESAPCQKKGIRGPTACTTTSPSTISRPPAT